MLSLSAKKNPVKYAFKKREGKLKIFSLVNVRKKTSSQPIENSLVSILFLDSFFYFHSSGQCMEQRKDWSKLTEHFLYMGSDYWSIECYSLLFFFFKYIFINYQQLENLLLVLILETNEQAMICFALMHSMRSIKFYSIL